MEKQFPTWAVVSAVNGILMGREFSKVVEVIEFTTGTVGVFTHQIPALFKPAAKEILRQHPQLKNTIEESNLINPDNVNEWAKKFDDRYGETLTLIGW